MHRIGRQGKIDGLDRAVGYSTKDAYAATERGDYKRAGDRFRTFQDWERDDLIGNLVAPTSTNAPRQSS